MRGYLTPADRHVKEVDDVTTHTPGIEEHPDIVALRARYEKAGSTPTAQTMDGLTLLAGLYLAISPWVIGFSGKTPLKVNDLIIGLAVALLAVGFASAYGRTHGVTFVVPVLGVWTIVAPWVIAGDMATMSTIISNVIVGACCVLLGGGAASVGMARMRRRRDHTG